MRSRFLASLAVHRALGNLKSLQDAVTFKERFYSSACARYDLAKPGAFKLLPSEFHSRELERDYSGMAVMIDGYTPTFETILEALRVLEAEITGL